MSTYVFKLTRRSIRSFFGRYMALLLIVALSAGFFAGLKVTKDAMADTCDNYLAQQHFYDFRLMSTLGFSEEDVQALSELPCVEAAEGAKTADVLIAREEDESPLKLFSMQEEVNVASLTEGRLPKAEDECLADAGIFGSGDIGTVLRLADEKSEAADMLANTEFTITGLANSPLYLSDDRGSANIGSGTLEGFLCLPADAFTSEIYTEVNLVLKETAHIYSDAYKELIEKYEDEITEEAEKLADERYEKILADMRKEAMLAAGQQGTIPAGGGQETIPAENASITEFTPDADFTDLKPEVYVLTREENAGYVSFESDTSIVSGIANMFPVFFILIAILVCITTMTRMVDEERTQIGVLKAMGLSNAAITAKYLLYAGSATLLGWAAGFFLGTWGIPQIFWFAYRAIYDFAPLSYLFGPNLAALTLCAAMAGILGSTFFSCRRELVSEPAKLIRPRAAKAGKRILLERVTPLWSRLPFLQKATLRNMFRYKRRLVMMLVGISCCAGLVVTAFGVRDSMIDTAALQFDGVQKYDMEVSFSDSSREELCEKLDKFSEIDSYMLCSESRVDLHGADKKHMNAVSLFSFADTDRLSDYWDFHADGENVPFPETGEAVVSCRIAEKLSLSIGDELEIQDADMQPLSVIVSGIFDNYVNNFVVISAETHEELFDEWKADTALLSVNEVNGMDEVNGVDEADGAGGVSGSTQELAKELTQLAEVTGVTQLSAARETVDSALSCLDYIIWFVVLFSGALAFIVIFNLTNINLAERSREIATVQVLGFYPKETESYVLRENLVLSIIAGFIGLPLGTVFHGIVMHMIVVDNMSFDIHVAPLSYCLALACTCLFAVAVNLFMRRQIAKINMAESLKAVE